MAVSSSDAVAAYTRAVQNQKAPGLEARDQAQDAGFATALNGAMHDVMATLNEGEQQSLAAAVGKADINEVITAVSKAEITLQTVVAIRDRVIQAYQDIMRMPI